MDHAWRIAIDTGGTFTDCLAIDPSGREHRVKVLSSGVLRAQVIGQAGPRTVRIAAPWTDRLEAAFGMAGHWGTVIAAEHGTLTFDRDIAAGSTLELAADEEAPTLAARLITRTPVGSPLPPIRMRLGTTRGTNALLERRGSPVALFFTEGFADLLDIGDQTRPDLFALKIRKPAPLHEAVIEVPGRLDARGHEIRPLDLAPVEPAARALLARGIRCAAIALMHSWLNPAHEERLAEVLSRLGFEHISRSSALAPLMRILPRAQTTVVNAYLGAVIDRYTSRVAASLGGPGSLRMMTSSGGLVRTLHPKDSLLSGPAGGVVGAAAAGLAAGFDRTIAFDMGGTSTDVSRFDGRITHDFEHRVGDARILSPALAIQSVAAGGGSICAVRDGILRVGPESAGADPGPACYGRGGPLTITDCNLLLGRIDPRSFQVPIDEPAANARVEAALRDCRDQAGVEIAAADLLAGFIAIADERMADAIARISIREGCDARDYAMVCFGGAGGQHACGVADRLGITRIVVPADAGLLSAAGIMAARMERIAERQVLRTLGDLGDELHRLIAEVGERAVAMLCGEGVQGRPEVRTVLELRLKGQDSCIAVNHDGGDPAPAFVARFKDLYGHVPPSRPIELVAIRAIASEPAEPNRVSPAASQPVPTPSRRGSGTSVIDRASLSPGESVPGPAILTDPHSTTVLPQGWTAVRHASGSLILNAPSARQARLLPAAAREELLTGRLLAIARDMGQMLQRTALSTNVKERLDFSCAILDASGRLIANAPHIPVHLGALGVCVRRVMESLPLDEGDVAVTNHPAFGGSHLPDITVITPVYTGGERIAFVACRAHHAEIGGTRPGSMPTDATRLDQEGTIIPPMHLIRRGEPRWADVERCFTSGPHPTRALADNLADLAAQVAANHHGVQALAAFVSEHTAAALRHAMDSLTERASRGLETALSRVPVRELTAEEFLDDGSPLRVRITIHSDAEAGTGPRATIDFSGSAPTHPGNLNATPAIVRSAVMYVLRLLIEGELPLNEGLLRGVRIVTPPQSILDPDLSCTPTPAVAGGNTETSQRLVDTLLKALGLLACGQGTMNNILFGDDRFGYYETVCGGAGAGPVFHGASAVHTHMTNTRITDPEVLEHRYPVRLDRFAIRRGSGGRGRFQGGDGAVREFTFLAPCSLSVLTQHRTTRPFGVAGGEPGQPGAQHIIRANGRIEPLNPVDGREMLPGDRLILHTPGGGGHGPP